MVAAQGPSIVKQIPDQLGSSPLNEVINLRIDFDHPDSDESLILTVQQADGSPLPAGITLSLKSPTRVGSYDTPDRAHGLAVVANLAYVADGASGLQIIDISTPSNPIQIGGYNTPSDAWGVAVVGNLAYVAAAYSGLLIIDVSVPSVPALLGSYDTPDTAWDVVIVDNLAYVADKSGLQLIDISTPSAPTLVGSYNTQAISVTVVGNLTYVAAAGSGLLIIDVSAPSVPALLGSYDTPVWAQDVAVEGNLAYVADGDSGLQIIDVSIPSAPTWVGIYNTPDYARGVMVVGNLAYVADRESGLQIIDVSTLSGVGSYQTPSSAYRVTLVGNLAYVADYFSGLQIIDGSQWELSGMPALQDSYILTLKVEDSQGLSAAYNLTLFGLWLVNPLQNQTSAVNEAFNYMVPADTFTDPSDPLLDYAAQSAVGGPLPTWLTFTPGTRTFSGTPLSGAQSSNMIEVTATNDASTSGTDQFILTVPNRNPTQDNPLINQVLSAGNSLNYVFAANTFSDQDTDPLSYVARLSGDGALPSWLSFFSVTRTFSGSPVSGDQGDMTIEVTASDGFGGSVVGTFTITVMNCIPVQDKPLQDQSIAVGDEFTYTFPADTFSDCDGEVLAYSAVQIGSAVLPSWLSFISNTRSFSGVPTSGNQGSIIIEVTASDGFGGNVAGTFVLTVNNFSPILQNPLDDTTAFYNVPFGITIPVDTFTDLDGDVLLYSATGIDEAPLPIWLTFSSSTRMLTGTPIPTDQGTTLIEIRGDDTYGGIAMDTFSITVKAVSGSNNPPLVVVEIPDQSANLNEQWRFIVPANTFEDPDNDPLTYTTTLEGGDALPIWLTFDDQSRTFSGVPTAVAAIRISVRVEDGRGGFALDTFTLNIQDTRNQAPVLLNQLPNQHVDVGSNFRYTVPVDTFTDPNDDVLIYSAAQSADRPLPGWLKFDGPTRTFSGKPSSKDTNTYADKKHTIQVCANDGDGSACSSFFLVVVGESEIEQVITALIILASIGSTLFAAYRNYATIWNWTCMQWYRLPRQAAVVGKQYVWEIPIDEDRIKDVQAFTQKGKALKANKLLPDWLDYQHKDNKLIGTPATDDVTTLIIRVLNYNGRILGEFKLGIFETEAGAQEYENEEARVSGRDKRDMMMRIFSRKGNDIMQERLLTGEGSSVE